MSDDYQRIMDEALRLNVDRLKNATRHLSRKHRSSLGTHEWFDLGLAVGLLESLQKYALEQKEKT